MIFAGPALDCAALLVASRSGGIPISANLCGLTMDKVSASCRARVPVSVLDQVNPGRLVKFRIYMRGLIPIKPHKVIIEYLTLHFRNSMIAFAYDQTPAISKYH
jgi:hypothetical protein